MVLMQESFNALFSTTPFSCTMVLFSWLHKWRIDAIDSLTRTFSIFQLIFSSHYLYIMDPCEKHVQIQKTYIYVLLVEQHAAYYKRYTICSFKGTEKNILSDKIKIKIYFIRWTHSWEYTRKRNFEVHLPTQSCCSFT